MKKQIALVENLNAPANYDDAAVKEYLTSLGNNLKPVHKDQFIVICKAFGLNPFLREIYGVPYGDKFSIIVGYEVYIKRAERTGLLNGWEKGIKIEGNETIAWVKIHRKDWQHPFYHEVYLSEYIQQSPLWKSKPKTMIQKVAIAQGFRLAFSEHLGGIPYTADEVPEVMPEAPNKALEIAQVPEQKEPVEVAQTEVTVNMDIEEFITRELQEVTDECHDKLHWKKAQDWMKAQDWYKGNSRLANKIFVSAHAAWSQLEQHSEV